MNNWKLSIADARNKLTASEMIQSIEKENNETTYYYNKNYIRGKTIQYELVDGIWITNHDITLSNSVIFPEEEIGMIRMNYCILGRCELELKTNKVFYVGTGDFVAAYLKNTQLEHNFPSGFYKGISIVASKEKMNKFLRSIFGDTNLSAEILIKKILENDEYIVLSNHSRIEEIMKDIASFNDVFWKEKAIIKLGELILLLINNDKDELDLKGKYYDKNFTEKIKQIKKELTKDIGNYISIEEIARRYDISSRAFSDCFKEIYGKTYYAYIKEFRIKKAAELLYFTDKNVGEIAITLGYQNASKFSKAFSDIMGTTPMKYRKSAAVLEQK